MHTRSAIGDRVIWTRTCRTKDGSIIVRGVLLWKGIYSFVDLPFLLVYLASKRMAVLLTLYFLFMLIKTPTHDFLYSFARTKGGFVQRYISH